MAPPDRLVYSVVRKDYQQMNNPSLDDYLTPAADSTTDSNPNPPTTHSSFSIDANETIDPNTTVHANTTVDSQ
jgi:hypothetical protein